MDSQKRNLEGPARGASFGLSAVVTVATAIALAGMAMHYFRRPGQPARIMIPSPPEIRYVERQRPEPVAVPVKPPPPPPAPPPPTAEMVGVGPFQGVWRERGRLLPMFQLSQSAVSVSGAYSPANWTGPYAFKDGIIRGSVAEFAASDQIQREHFRITLLANGDAEVEKWMAPEDAMRTLALLNRPGVLRTPLQAYITRKLIEEELKRLGKPTPMGTFRRVSDPGA